MQMHGDSKPAGQDAAFPEIQHSARLPLLCRLAGTSFAAIERDAGLARGAISNWNGGRTYAYPRLQAAVLNHLTSRINVPGEELRDYLFSESVKPGSAGFEASRGKDVHDESSQDG